MEINAVIAVIVVLEAMCILQGYRGKWFRNRYGLYDNYVLRLPLKRAEGERQLRYFRTMYFVMSGVFYAVCLASLFGPLLLSVWIGVRAVAAIAAIGWLPACAFFYNGYLSVMGGVEAHTMLRAKAKEAR